MSDQSKTESKPAITPEKKEAYDYIDAQEAAVQRTMEAVRASNAKFAAEEEAKAAEAKAKETPAEEKKPDDAKPTEAKTEEKPKAEPKPEEADKGLEKAWPTVMRVDRENRELKKTVEALRKDSAELKEVQARLQDYKDAALIVEKLKTDPYAVLDEMKLDPEKWAKRRANKGQPTVEERLENVEKQAQQEAAEKERAAAEAAFAEYKSSVGEVYGALDEEIRSKFTLDDVLEVSSLHFESTHDILDPDDAVKATLESKGLKQAPKPAAKSSDGAAEAKDEKTSGSSKQSETTLTNSWSEPKPLFSDDEEARFQKALRMIRNR